MFKPFVIGSMVIVIFFNLLGMRDARVSQLKAAHPAPGHLVDIGGYRLHIHCEGEGNPTVVMDAGLGNPGMVWAYVQPDVAKKTRVCVYDRAGLGWSDPSPRERSAGVMVDELRLLLDRAHIEGPYVLVGHSFGGMILRLYTHTYPKEVVGLVLVDSYRYTQMEENPQFYGRGNPVIPLALLALNLWVSSGIPALNPSWLPVLDMDKLPREDLDVYRDLFAADPKSVREARAELALLEKSNEDEKSARIASLGNIPLIVLSHGLVDSDLPDFDGAKHLEDAEKFWLADQAQLASLSPNGRLIVASESGHYIQFDQPDLVLSAIEQVIASARRE